MALIDILISTRNDDDDALSSTLNSIYESSVRDLRVLLVNDSDRDLPKLPLNTDIQVDIINNGKCLGLTNSLKAAEAQIESEYMARVDVGDSVDRSRFESQLKYLETNSNVSLVGCVTKIYVKKNGHQEFRFESEYVSSFKELKSILSYRNPIVHGSILVRVNALRSVGGYSKEVKVAQDLDLYLKLVKRGNIAILNSPLHHHTFNYDSSITLNNNRRSVYYAFRSRLKYIDLRDKISLRFVYGFIRDILLLSLPSNLLREIRMIRING